MRPELAARSIVELCCVCSIILHTRLAQAQSEGERKRISERMEGDGELVKILRTLQETEKDDAVTEERARRQAVRKSRVDANLDAMDVDDTGVNVQTLSLNIIRYKFLLL